MGYNYYAVLGVSRGASDYDIKMAFRKKAIINNPERNSNESSKQMFTLICEAYEVLSNKFRKAIYDQYGEEGLKRGVTTTMGFVPGYEYDRDTKRTYQNFFGTDSPYADLLNAYRAQGTQYAVDHGPEEEILKKCRDDEEQEERAKFEAHSVITSLEEVYKGCKKLLSVPVKEIDPCSDQLTLIDTHRILHLEIKPGLPENTVFKFPPGPNEYPRTAKGILVTSKDKPHPVFWREGADLHMNRKASLKDALTGFSFTVNTLDGRILHIPITDLINCNQSVKVIKSEGMPHVEAPHRRGDLFIHLSVDYPKTLSPELRKTLITLLDDDKTEKNTTRTILDSKLQLKTGDLDLN